jgi:hypothetical protein
MGAGVGAGVWVGSAAFVGTGACLAEGGIGVGAFVAGPDTPGRLVEHAANKATTINREMSKVDRENHLCFMLFSPVLDLT